MTQPGRRGVRLFQHGDSDRTANGMDRLPELCRYLLVAQVSLKCFTRDSVSSLQAGVPNNNIDEPSGRILRQLLPQHFVEGGRRQPRTGDVQFVLEDRRPKAEDFERQLGEALECLVF